MSKRILFLVYLITASALAHSAPGVWERMQNGSTPSTRGVVTAVEMSDSQIYFKVETRDAFGDLVTRQESLCQEDFKESEEMRASLMKIKMEVLQESLKSGKPIEYGVRGPWKPCVISLRSLAARGSE